MALAMTSTNLCSRGALGRSAATTRRTGRASSMRGYPRVVADATHNTGSSNSKPAAAASRASGVARPRPPPLAAFAADAPTATAVGAGPVIPTLRELRQSIPAECFEPDLAESLKYAAIDLTAGTHVALPFARHSSRFVPETT